MSCTGDCFYVVLPETPIILNGPSNESRPTPIVGPCEAYRYSPLKPWQTRKLCLHPSQALSLQEGEGSPLSADLSVATVSDTEGIVIEKTGKIVEYTALSYTWGYSQLSETLICNQQRKMISSSNATALLALRNPKEHVYIWVDAICINQDDAEEKLAQVARMLNIYKKANPVVAWLGEPDGDSVLGFVCRRKLTELRTAVSNFHATMHSPTCLERLRAIYLSIRSLYNRPYINANKGPCRGHGKDRSMKAGRVVFDLWYKPARTLPRPSTDTPHHPLASDRSASSSSSDPYIPLPSTQVELKDK